jgi:hypothetical protein
MGTAEKIRDLSRRIDEKQQEGARLARALRSSLAVQQVWPEAFKDGQSCTRCTYMKGDKVSRRFLRRADGVEFELTREQYEALRALD